METKKILIGDSFKAEWLMDAVEKYIRENPMVEDLDVHLHFKMRIDLIADILADLRIADRIERIILSGKMYFRIHEITEEELRAVSMPMPFGTL